MIEEAFEKAGFKNVHATRVNAPVLMSSAAECVQFEKESFGALHQMLNTLPQDERDSVWNEIQAALEKFEVNGSFAGQCEMIVAVGEK